MSNTYGRQLLTTTGNPIQASADGTPEWKTGGITIDWSTVAAVASTPYTIPAEGYVVPVGQKFLRYGQVMTKISNAPTQVITETGSPASGSFVLAGVRPDTGQFGVSGAIVQAATAAQVRTALASIFGTDAAGNPNCTVSGSAGGPWTVTLAGPLAFAAAGAWPLMVLMTNSLGGGTAPSVTIAYGNAGANQGMYGPYDSAASDGRQTLLTGEIGILNETILESGLISGLPTGPTANVGLIIGGRVFLDRVLQAGGGSHSLAAGPTRAELVAAMPRLMLVEN